MLRAWADDVLAMLLPGRCPGCGRRAEPVCGACAATMRAAPAGGPIPGVTRATAVFAYEGVARELIAGVKYRNERGSVRWLAARLARECERAPIGLVTRPCDVVTWIPASARRRALRGVDHGALLARALWAELGLTARCLLQRDAGPPQTGRAACERRTGPVLHGVGAISGRSVLVVDDVVTTGATLSAAARVLRACGARDVQAATLARTPRPGDRARVAAYTRCSD